MKHRLSRALPKNELTSAHYKKLWVSSQPSLPLLFFYQFPADDPVANVLYIVMIFIVLLFIAVALILPLALHLSQRKNKKSRSPAAPAPVVDEPHQPPASLPNSALADTLPSAPALAIEDLAATEPGLRSIRAEREPETIPASGARPANIGWQIAGLSDTGLRRELNEDNLLMWETDMPSGLYVVADGLGGHDAGEIASHLTINAIQQHFMSHPPGDAVVSDAWLTQAVMAANETVLANQGDRTQDKRMGSTLVMAVVTKGQAHIANVGDSRAYRLHSAGIEQISIDHSFVERLIQIGQLTREEARTHKQKNVVYSTIGDKSDTEIGFYHVDLQPGDRLLLCSDGLSGMLSDDEILQVSRSQPEPAGACRALIEAAKRAGGHDNITTILVQMDGGERR